MAHKKNHKQDRRYWPIWCCIKALAGGDADYVVDNEYVATLIKALAKEKDLDTEWREQEAALGYRWYLRHRVIKGPTQSRVVFWLSQSLRD